jgi:hypothetical protein
LFPVEQNLLTQKDEENRTNIWDSKKTNSTIPGYLVVLFGYSVTAIPFLFWEFCFDKEMLVFTLQSFKLLVEF